MGGGEVPWQTLPIIVGASTRVSSTWEMVRFLPKSDGSRVIKTRENWSYLIALGNSP